MRGGIVPSILALLTVAVAGGQPARSANIVKKEFWMWGPRYTAKVPLCEERGPLKTIESRFRTKEGKFWNSDLKIIGIEKIQEVSWQPWAPGTIPRRFCSATVLVSDGLWRSLYYAITEDAGMLGVSYGIEFCVVGLDREWSYQPNCVRAKP